MLLARFRSAGDLYELTAKYDRSASAISEGVNELVLYLDDKWSFLLHFDKDGVMSPSRLASYAAAIHAAGAPLKSICGFIDCTLRHICRPSLWQRIAYTRHKRYHALKYQEAVRLRRAHLGNLPSQSSARDVFRAKKSGVAGTLGLFIPKY